jgi:hypothetical protein
MTTTKITPEVAALAMKAADVIKVRGHCKGMLIDHNNNVCLVGALTVVTFSRKDAADANDILVEIAHRVGTDPAIWNDAEETTADDVITMFRDIGLAGGENE